MKCNIARTVATQRPEGRTSCIAPRAAHALLFALEMCSCALLEVSHFVHLRVEMLAFHENVVVFMSSNAMLKTLQLFCSLSMVCSPFRQAHFFARIWLAHCCFQVLPRNVRVPRLALKVFDCARAINCIFIHALRLFAFLQSILHAHRRVKGSNLSHFLAEFEPTKSCTFWRPRPLGGVGEEGGCLR